MHGAIGRGIDRFFCTSNRDGNASENSWRRQWRGATLRSVWLMEPSDNEFYCSIMTRQRFPLIYRSYIAPFASRLWQILNLQIYFMMHLQREYWVSNKNDYAINNQYCFLWSYTFVFINNYKHMRLIIIIYLQKVTLCIIKFN